MKDRNAGFPAYVRYAGTEEVRMLLTSKFNSACKVCNKRILVGDRISWIKGEKGASHAACSDEGKTVQAAQEESRATEADIEIPCPEGLNYLGYQKGGIAFACKRPNTLIADEMGLGKTVQALGFINANTDITNVLVVCPKSLIVNWKREAHKWLVRPINLTIINYDMLKKIPPELTYDLLIVDEGQYIKNPKAKRSGFVKALAKRSKRVIVLTGTPIENRPIEIWPILQILAPEVWDPKGYVKGKVVEAGNGAGFFRFAKRYCNAYKDTFGWNFNGHSNLEEFQEKLRSSCMVRRLKSEVLTELPPKRRQVISLPNEADDLDIVDFPDDWDDAIRYTQRKVAFEDFSRVRHEQGLAKVPLAIEHITDALESSKKVIVFAHHKDVIDKLREGLLEYGPVVITGDTSQNERTQAVDAFQNNPNCRIFIGSITAAGVGLTLTASSHVIFVELDWVPARISQAEDRAHRIGQTESVLVQHLVLAGTLDEKMTKMLVEKQEVADMALDNATFQNVTDRAIVESPENLRKRLLKEASLTEEDIDTVHAKVRWLAARCDGAMGIDGQGFNKLDTNFGKTLASLESLSVRQAVYASKMIKKYARQLEGMN